ncbi:MAG: ParB/RepB/Spo0J family partition protein [Actinomycetaceae bacterium]|nr:ParB/RepB/Spo0J family partition protein [Actinomycetaceae bacterium]
MPQKKSGLGRGLDAILGQNAQTHRPQRRSYAQQTQAQQPHAHEVDTPILSKKTRPADIFFESSADVSRETSSKRHEMPHVKDILGSTTQHDSQQSPVIKLVHIDDISPNRQQPRTVFDEDELTELADSIAQVGVLQPIVVRPTSHTEKPYELIMGERRWRATRLAGLQTIPALIRHTADNDLLRDALVENIHRSQLNPLEEAAAYQQLLKDFDCTQAELSSRVAKSRSQITNTIRLLRLPVSVQMKVASGVLSAGHARALLGLDNEAAMEVVADRIISEGLSVRSTEEIVALGVGLRPESPSTQRPQQNLDNEGKQMQDHLVDLLDTKVTIKKGKKRGKIIIDFADDEDLQRIVDYLLSTDKITSM